MVFAFESATAEERNNYFFLNFAGYSVRFENDIKDFEESGAAGSFGYGRVISDYAAFEIFISTYGEVKDEILNIERKASGRAFGTYLVGSWPISEYFRLNGKVGAANWKFTLEDDVLGKENQDGTDVLYGAGIALDADHDSTIRLEYDAYLNGVDVSVISLGFQHNF